MTVASMTGFARVQGGDEAATWTWEARSVNGKGLDVRLRLPGGLEALDSSAREMASKAFARGNISLNLTITRTAEPTALRLNEPLLNQLLDIAADVSRRAPALAKPSIDGILSMRGVLEQVEDQAEDDAEARNKAILQDLAATLAGLAEMRQTEGRRLAEVLSAQLDRMTELKQEAEQNASLRPEKIRERLRHSVAALLDSAPSLPEERLAQEAALLAAKGDVREELDRLQAHVAAGRDLIAKGGAVGRRLDFLCQEFNREANTLCSKSGDVDLTRTGLELKAVIEQFREQVQNIE